MCTVTWIHERDRLQIHCNRDERHNRESAEAPRHSVRNGVTCLAPRDGRAGGTWIAVNEYGLAVCLLNHYVDENEHRAPSRFTSRGELVLSLMDCESPAAVAERLNTSGLGPYRPCIVLALASGETVRRFTWDRRELVCERIERMEPQISSSFMTRPVIESRLRLFRNRVRAADGSLDGELLERFHRSHHPTRSAYSVCMHRPDAHTVSYTQLTIDRELAVMDYQSESPCRRGPVARAELPVGRLSRAGA